MNIEVKKTVKPLDYNESMKILERRVNDVMLGKKNELLWILEHNTVYTAGSSAKDEDILNKNLKVVKSNRGGKHTVHSPGQKVVYFVLNLNKREKNVRKLVNNIENCIINILKEYKIISRSDKKNIGIWINEKNNVKKIAAIGVKVKKWIAYHGFSINVSNDLTKYNEIIPCGIRDKGITSLKNMNIKNYKNIDEIIAKNFLDIFL
tara:strand:- start:1039 stop:1656 length:618 start_codon:yes stop_codon:yes gene_type:complete